MRGRLPALRRAFVFFVVAVVIAACTNEPPRDNSAANLMPAPANYTVTNTLDIQDAITKIAGTASIATGGPQFAAMIAAAGEVVKCYQKAGALEGRVYTKNGDPLKAGVVLIINKNQALDPGVFLSCVGVEGLASPASVSQPCANAYTLKKDNNEFFIGYVATDYEVCTALCSGLQGCTQ
jgi:hypothetical protein